MRPVIEDMEVFVDPFHGGEVLFLEDCQQRFSQLFPGAGWKDGFLASVMPQAFLARMLMNLKNIYLKEEEYKQAISTIDKLLVLMPGQTQQMRDRGLLHYQLKNYALAKQDLEAYLTEHPEASDTPNIQAILRGIK